MAREGRKGLYRCRMPFPEIRKYLEREIFLIGIKLNIFAGNLCLFSNSVLKLKLI